MRNNLDVRVLFIIIFVSFAVFSLWTVSNRAEPILSNLKPVPTLAQDILKAHEQRYLALVRTQSPREAIDMVKNDAAANPEVMQYCHEFMHSVGQEAMKTLREFTKAAAYQDEMCTSGYIHGVLQEHFSSTNDIVLSMQTVCGNHTRQDFFAWECYHGVGHGLMYFSGNDLPVSITRCEAYSTPFVQSACANGVYMENFAADEVNHPTRFRKQDDPSYPCPIQKEAYKQDCYQTAPLYFLSLHNSDYIAALDWCKTVERVYRSFCYQGVGEQATRRNIQDIKVVEYMCMTRNNEQEQWCLVGIVNYYLSHYGSLKYSGQLCRRFEEKNKSVCRETVELASSMFE